MLPAAVVAPVAASLADRWRRERFLLAVVGAGAVSLAGSAVAFHVGGGVAVYALAAAVGVTSTLFRPAHQALRRCFRRSRARPTS